MSFDNSLADGKTDPGPFILSLRMQALEDLEDSFGEPWFNTDTVIGDREHPMVIFESGINMNNWCYIRFLEFQCIPYQVLEQLGHLRAVRKNLRQRCSGGDLLDPGVHRPRLAFVDHD